MRKSAVSTATSNDQFPWTDIIEFGFSIRIQGILLPTDQGGL